MRATTVVLVVTGAALRQELADELVREGHVVFCASSAAEPAIVLEAEFRPTAMVIERGQATRRLVAQSALVGRRLAVEGLRLLLVDDFACPTRLEAPRGTASFLAVPRARVPEILRDLRGNGDSPSSA